MELMSPLLLCALAALFPQALGYKSSLSAEVKAKSKSSKRMEMAMSKTVWLKRKTPSEVTLDMVMEYLRHSDQCSGCMECINIALNSLSNPKTTPAPSKHMLTRDLLLNDILENYHQYKVVRNSRDAKKDEITKSKNVTVTKYNIDGQVYAIKLKEHNSNDTENPLKSTCQVYSVKKYHPCESPKVETIFTSARKKANRRSKKQTKTTQPLTTGRPHSQSPVSRDKALTESFMTSIEELY